MFFDQSNASLIYRKLGADLQAPEKGEILKHMHFLEWSRAGDSAGRYLRG